MMMRYGSVCSGIEAATVAWHGLGWEPAFFSEIEKFPSAVLAHHYPDVPNYGDMTRFSEWPDAALDVLVGGTPCQSFSVAGLRKGLADPRGNLMLTFGAIAGRYRPKWLVWENVPGVLSSNGGRDFGTFLGMLAELGYGFAYRILDAQFFGVAQRRRRVFVVGHLGDWRPAAAVLFERHSLQGHPAPRRQAGKGTAAGFETGPGGGRFTDLSPTLDCRAKNGPMQNQLGAGVVQPLGLGEDGELARALNGCPTASGRHDASVDTFVAGPLMASGKAAGSATQQDAEQGMLVAQPIYGIDNENNAFNSDGVCGPLMKDSPSGGGRPLPAIAHPQTMAFKKGGQAVMLFRRLTPVECERLQGFPDEYTNIPHRGKPAADGPRYKALGNSMAVPCMAWIGRRLQAVEDILNGKNA